MEENKRTDVFGRKIQKGSLIAFTEPYFNEIRIGVITKFTNNGLWYIYLTSTIGNAADTLPSFSPSNPWLTYTMVPWEGNPRGSMRSRIFCLTKEQISPKLAKVYSKVIEEQDLTYRL